MRLNLGRLNRKELLSVFLMITEGKGEEEVRGAGRNTCSFLVSPF